MDSPEEAKALLAKQGYREAAQMLDRIILRSGGSDELWYLRGMASLKMRNYDSALDCFERALVARPRSKYYLIKGMALFEIFDMREAEEAFKRSLAMEPDDPVAHLFLSLCYLFQDDPRSSKHLQIAYEKDSKRTRHLLMNFYSLFLQNDPRISPAMHARLEARLRGIGSG
jgi:tetratricopeptide (TPR) repeat protein